MSEDFSLSSVRVAQTPEERYDEYLQSRGKRNTKQKQQLLEHVFSRHEHFDAEGLIEQTEDIGRATVYRTLKEFVEAGLLRKFEIDGREVYEHDYGYPQHDHLHCEECQALIEFQSEELKRLIAAIAAEHRFSITGHRFIITGLCESCKAKRRTRRRVDRI